MLQSKYERELYIGNLPPELTNDQLLDLLNRALKRMNATIAPGDPITNVWIGSDGRYAFAIFRSVEETNMALSLKGVSLLGYPIKVSKINMNARANYSASTNSLTNLSNFILNIAPKTVGEITASTAGYKMTEKLQLGNIPKNMTPSMIEKLVKIFGKVLKVELIMDPVTKTPNGQCFVEFSNEVELQKAASGAMGMKLGESILETKKVPISQTADTFAIGALIKTAAGQLSANPESMDSFIGIAPKHNSVLESHPSRVIKLKNLVNVAELLDNSYYEEVFEDIQEQCKKYGRILAIEIPRPNINGSHIPGLGFVYVQYESVDHAMMAVKQLNGIKFAGRKVEVVYYPEDPFKRHMLDL
jgi:splicing factor U2AF subunit